MALYPLDRKILKNPTIVTSIFFHSDSRLNSTIFANSMLDKLVYLEQFPTDRFTVGEGCLSHFHLKTKAKITVVLVAGLSRYF